jgi:hypothetical protein
VKDAELQQTSPNVASTWQNLDVHHLILETEDFIVFIDSKLDVDWQTSEKYDGIGQKDTRRHNEMLNRAADLECIPNDHLKKNVRLNFKRMLGEGVARSLDHDYDNADIMLEKAYAYITDRNVESARCWQLCTVCILGPILALLGLGLWAYRNLLIQAWGDAPYFLVLAAIVGPLGAVLSMIFRMGRNFPTSEAPRMLHILEASSRVLAGCFSGFLIAGSVKLGLILPVFRDVGQTHLAMILAAMASGASERWAPSLIAQLEGSSDVWSKKESKL